MMTGRKKRPTRASPSLRTRYTRCGVRRGGSSSPQRQSRACNVPPGGTGTRAGSKQVQLCWAGACALCCKSGKDHIRSACDRLGRTCPRGMHTACARAPHKAGALFRPTRIRVCCESFRAPVAQMRYARDGTRAAALERGGGGGGWRPPTPW